MVLAALIAVAGAVSPCGDPTTDDGLGWSGVAVCLEHDGRPQAAMEAWRRAFESERGETVPGLLVAVEGLAHQTGDDALLLEIARKLGPERAGQDEVQAHVALAEGRFDDVGKGTCVWPLARYRRAGELGRQQKLEASVQAWSDVVTAPATGPGWRIDALAELREAALLGAASVYLGLESDGGIRFAQIWMAGAYPDLRGYARAFGTWKQEAGAVRLRVERDAFAPETMALLGDAEIERWQGIAKRLRTLLEESPDPATVTLASLEPVVAADVARVWSVQVLEGILADVEDERRRSSRESVLALLEARQAGVENRLGTAILAAVKERVDRIESALVIGERVRAGRDGPSPVVWSTTDYGD